MDALIFSCHNISMINNNRKLNGQFKKGAIPWNKDKTFIKPKKNVIKREGIRYKGIDIGKEDRERYNTYEWVECGFKGFTKFKWCKIVKGKPAAIKLRYNYIYRNKKYRNENWLKEKYLREGLSSTQIAKICDVYASTILRWLIKYDIKRRNNSYSVHIRENKNTVNLSYEAKQFIYGELLGDGHLTKGSKYACLFSYASRHNEYLEWLSSKLNDFGIEQSNKIYERIIKEKKYFQYFSKSYPELKEIRNIFYPDGIKIIPNKIEITPLLLRQWYIGDGSLIKPSKRRWNGKPYIKIAALGFNREDLQNIITKINNIGLRCTLNKDKIIQFSVYSTKDFLKYAGDCPVKCYQYKWEMD